MRTRKSGPFKCKLTFNSSRSNVHRVPPEEIECQNNPLIANYFRRHRSWIATLFLSVFGVFFGIMAKFALGRKLLLDHPSFFSGGFFSRDGPTEETMRASRFAITFHGRGWPKEETLAEGTDQHTTPPSKTLITRVSGANPGIFFISP